MKGNETHRLSVISVTSSCDYVSAHSGEYSFEVVEQEIHYGFNCFRWYFDSDSEGMVVQDELLLTTCF